VTLFTRETGDGILDSAVVAPRFGGRYDLRNLPIPRNNFQRSASLIYFHKE
jgi:hypothetical protein